MFHVIEGMQESMFLVIKRMLGSKFLLIESMHESRHESMLLVIKTMELVIESMQESMFLAFLLTRTMFTVLKGNTKYVNSNDGTNPISAVKILESFNLV